MDSRACLLANLINPPDYKTSRKTKINLTLFRTHKVALRAPLILNVNIFFVVAQVQIKVASVDFFFHPIGFTDVAAILTVRLNMLQNTVFFSRIQDVSFVRKLSILPAKVFCSG